MMNLSLCCSTGARLRVLAETIGWIHLERSFVLRQDVAHARTPVLCIIRYLPAF